MNERKLINEIRKEILKDIENAKTESEDENLLNQEITKDLKNGKCNKTTIRNIAKYLYLFKGIHRSRLTLNLLKLDESLNSYVPLSNEDFKDICHDLHFHLNDTEFMNVEQSIRSDIEADYNIVHFNNCLFDMEDLNCIANDKPVFSLTKIPYNFNSITKPDNLMKSFLLSSFEGDTDKVKGVLEIIGYLLTDGNVKEKAFFFTGIAGSGKSTLGNIIKALFDNKIGIINSGDLNNTHHTSNLLGNKLCFVEEPEYNKKFKDFVKQMVSQSGITVNPKGKQEITIPLMEKPKLCMFANNIPLNDVNKALLQKIVIVEFKKTFRNTDKAIPNLHKKIINDAESMEWLIYHSVIAYKELLDENRDFYWSKNEDDTGDLIELYSDPVAYYLRENYEITNDYYNENWETDSDFISLYHVPNYKELSAEILEWAIKQGVEVPTKRGNISGQTLKRAINRCYDLPSTFIDSYGRRQEYKAKPVNNTHHKGVYPLFLKRKH